MVHKSAITKRFRESFEIEEYKPRKSIKPSTRSAEKQKADAFDSEIVDNTNQLEQLEAEEETFMYEEIASGHGNDVGDEKVEIVYISEEGNIAQNKHPQSPAMEMSREEKFIQAVYPQFKGKTKLNMIEEILDLKRQNDLLSSKAKTYENTINRLLN